MTLASLLEPRVQIPQERKKFDNAALKALIIPVLIEQFLALLVGLADTMMVTYAGEAAVSGVSLVNQLNNIFIMIFTALASGGAVVASQYIGKGDRENGTEASGQLVMITTVISFLCTVLCLAFGGDLFDFLFGTVEKEVRSAGILYLIISAYSFPFLALYNGCAGLYRSMGKTKELMYVSAFMNAVNVVGNAIGIFVLHAGVRGVAYPSLISRALAGVIMIVMTADRNNVLYITVKGVFSWHWEMIRRIFTVAIPNSIESGLFQISKVALSSLVATFGTVQIAANGVAQSFWSLAALFCLSMGPVFITVIGQYTGAGDMEGADYYMKKLLRLTMMGAVSWNIFCFAVTPLLLKLFSLSAETAHLVLILCLIHDIFNGLLCPAAFSMSNGLRAAGDVKYTMYAALYATCICRVVSSWLLGHVLGMGAVGIALGMAFDWGVKALLILLRYRSGKWKNFRLI